MRPRRLGANNEIWLTSYADLITNLLIFFILIISASKIQTGKMEKIINSMSQTMHEETLAAAAKKVTKVLEEQNLTKNVSVTLTDAGLELAFDSGVTFASGSPEILAEMESPLDKVLAVLQPYREKYEFAVEGHTDEVPISSGRFKSNWELASARALVVRERLEAVGIPRNKARVEAYADTKPLAAKAIEGLDRDTVLAKHRRVVVRLY
jgi:chemotaxis protein MotB